MKICTHGAMAASVQLNLAHRWPPIDLERMRITCVRSVYLRVRFCETELVSTYELDSSCNHIKALCTTTTSVNQRARIFGIEFDATHSSKLMTRDNITFCSICCNCTTVQPSSLHSSPQAVTVISMISVLVNIIYFLR